MIFRIPFELHREILLPYQFSRLTCGVTRDGRSAAIAASIQDRQERRPAPGERGCSAAPTVHLVPPLCRRFLKQPRHPREELNLDHGFGTHEHRLGAGARMAEYHVESGRNGKVAVRCRDEPTD